MAYSFRWTCGWFGGTEYEVHGDGPAYRVEVRNDASEELRRHLGYKDETWFGEILPSIGLLRRSHRADQPLKPEVVEAFNAWRRAEYDRWMAEIKANPDKYGTLDDNPMWAPPAEVRGGHFVVGTGWMTAEGPVRTLWMIDYYAADDKSASDCYPDFLDSRAEAERIAPEFMRELDWAVRFEIRPVTETLSA